MASTLQRFRELYKKFIQYKLPQVAAQIASNPALNRVATNLTNQQTRPGSFVKFGEGLGEGSTWGLVDIPNIAPSQNLRQKLAYGTGYAAGLVNPLNPINKLAAGIKATRAFKPIQQPLGRLASQGIARGGVSKLLGTGVANVAQGLPYGAAYGVGKTLKGEKYTGKEAARDIGFDLALGSIPLVGGLAIGAKATGFKKMSKFEGLDKKLRAEISDLVARINPKKLSKVMEERGGFARLGDFFEHSGLYKQYPELKQLKVEFAPGSGGQLGSFNPQTFSIKIDPTLKTEQMRSTLLHEIQHTIQEIEGFAKGGSPDSMRFGVLENIGKKRKELEDFRQKNWGELSDYIRKRDEANRAFRDDPLVKRASELEKIGKYKEAIKIYDSLGGKYDVSVPNARKVEIELQNQIAKLNDRLKSLDTDFFGDVKHKEYSKLAGEIEARAIELRKNWTAQKRREIPLTQTVREMMQKEGIKPEDVITRYDSGTSASLKKSTQSPLSDTTWYRGGTGRSGERGATFYTKDPSTAQEFAQRTGGKVSQENIQLKNPLVTEDRLTLFEKIFGKQKAKDIVIDGKYSKYPDSKKIYESMKNNFDESLLEEKLIFPELKKQGYDGVILKQGQYDQPELMKFDVAQPPLVKGGVGVTSNQISNTQAGVLRDRKLFPSVESATTKPQQIVSQKAGQTTADGVPGGIQGGSSSGPIISQDPIKKITELLSEAKPMRGQQEALYSAERARRTARVASLGSRVPGEKGYYAQLGQLKGELPKVQFERIRQNLTQNDIDSLFDKIEASELLPLEKISAKGGLAKLLGAEGGQIPVESEIKLLSEIFPPEFIKAIQSKRPLMQKIFEGLSDVLSVPRSLMASFDLSAPLRQGVFLIGRPKQWIPAFKNMFKAFVSEESFIALNKQIKSRSTYQQMRQSGLSIMDAGATPLKREERFMSQLAEKVPVLGRGVRASNRAYTGFLNKLRADVFDDILKSTNGKHADDIAKFVNSATGRGDLGAFKRASGILSTALFSPRLIASRLNLINPLYYTKLAPPVRKEALKSLLTFIGTGVTVLTLAELGGASVGKDPRSADFGKIKIGDTRYDIWGGFQQQTRLLAQLVTGKLISSTTGTELTLGEGYKPLTRFDILLRYFESKESPVVSFISQWMKGKTAIGEDFEIKKAVAERFIPMVAQDVYDLYKERGAGGTLMGIPAIFGTGVQTYSPKAHNIVSASKSVRDQAKQFIKQGRTEDAQKLLRQNVGLMRQAQILEPLDKQRKTLRKSRDTIRKNVNIPRAQKREIIKKLDARIKTIEEQMEKVRKRIE